MTVNEAADGIENLTFEKAVQHGDIAIEMYDTLIPFGRSCLPGDRVKHRRGISTGKVLSVNDSETSLTVELPDGSTNDWSFADVEPAETPALNEGGGVVGAYPDGNPKTQYGMAKPSFNAIPPIAELHLGRAMQNGAGKYGAFNWRENQVTASVYYDAMRRHLAAYWDGENNAEDSGCHHLAHVMACCAILLDASAVGKLNDDRGEGMAPEVIGAWTVNN